MTDWPGRVRILHSEKRSKMQDYVFSMVSADRTGRRMVLDCGFKTPESPALRGFVGGPRALATAALYLVLLSNGLPHPKIRLKKFGFSPKSVPANMAKKLPPQRCFKPLLIAIFNFPHKRPTFVFAGESGYTLGFAQRIAHSGSHGETGAFPPSTTVRLCAASEIDRKSTRLNSSH